MSNPGLEQVRSATAALMQVDPRDVRLTRSATGKYNTTAFAEAPGQEPWVVQIAPPDDPRLHLFYEHRMMRRLPALHEQLRSALATPVAQILAHERLMPEAGGRDVLIQQRLPGVPLSEAPGVDREPVMREVGEFLRKIHTVTGVHYGYPPNIDDNGRETDPPAAAADSWAEAFCRMWDRLINDLTNCGGYSPEEGAAFRQLLEGHRQVFDHPVAPALLHMDVWDQNILVEETSARFTGLVDWDRALYGDPEIEFAVLDYCGVSTPAFWRGYGRPDPRQNSAEAAIRRVFYLLYELQKYIVIRRARQNDPHGGDAFKRRVAQFLHSSGLPLPEALERL